MKATTQPGRVKGTYVQATLYSDCASRGCFPSQECSETRVNTTARLPYVFQPTGQRDARAMPEARYEYSIQSPTRGTLWKRSLSGSRSQAAPILVSVIRSFAEFRTCSRFLRLTNYQTSLYILSDTVIHLTWLSLTRMELSPSKIESSGGSSESRGRGRGRGRGRSRGGLGKYLRARGRGRGGGRPAEFRERLVLEGEQAEDLDEEEIRELQQKYSRRQLGTNADRYVEDEPELGSDGKLDLF